MAYNVGEIAINPVSVYMECIYLGTKVQEISEYSRNQGRLFQVPRVIEAY